MHDCLEYSELYSPGCFCSVPGVTIATDIICGFPTETEEDFEETMSLVKHYKFPSLFINQFFPRPGTPAAKMQRIPAEMVKKRTKRVSELFQSYYPYSHKVSCMNCHFCAVSSYLWPVSKLYSNCVGWGSAGSPSNRDFH